MFTFKNTLKKIIIPAIIAIVISALLIPLLETKLFEIIEYKAFDQKFINRFISPQKNKDIIIIAIDDESLSQNTKPLLFWGKDFASVIKKLSQNGVKSIAMDYIQEISLQDYEPQNDEELARALMSGKTVLLSYINYINGEFIKPADRLNIAVTFYKMNNTQVQDQISNLGCGNIEPDIDGVIRSQELLFQDKDKVNHAALALAAAVKYLGMDLRETKREENFIKIKDKIIPLNKQGKMYINFAGTSNSFKFVPFCEVLKKAKNNDDSYFKENFEGKIALIGITAMSGRDFVVTPFNTMFTPVRMTGIELHANTINTILEGNYIFRVDKIWVIILIFIFSIFTALTCSLLDIPKASIITILISIIFIIISTVCFNFFNIWLPVVSPLTGILFSFSITSIYNYLLMGREKRQIKNIFERFVASPVVKKMLLEPEKVGLGGQKKEITILFSDINDFTTISEKIPPEELIELLNSYLTIMTDLILDSEGTLKQFVGDEIMVIYGAPLEQKDHPIRAVRTGIAMLKKLDELRESGEMDIKVKIGINTGEAVLGNVGSIKRMEYAAVGDSVNFTSRVMHLNKEFKTFMLISEETYKRVKVLEEEGIKFIPMTPKEVKGKSGTYKTYEVKY